MNRGFTLLEVMVALAVLAIALTTLLGSQNQSMFAAGQADFASRSAMLARSKMAEIVAAEDNAVEQSGDFDELHPGYTWQVTVDTPDLSAETGPAETGSLLRRIRLNISHDQQGQTLTLTRVVVRGERR